MWSAEARLRFPITRIGKRRRASALHTRREARGSLMDRWRPRRLTRGRLARQGGRSAASARHLRQSAYMLAPRLEIRSPTPASRFQFLTVPGYAGSGPEHWQTQWERDDPAFVRVEQRDWDHPDVDEWTLAIEAAVRGAEKPVVFVAHSCGVTAVAHWTKRFGPDI